MQNKKRCPTCQISKDRSEFHRDKQKKDGLKTYCKLCHKIRNDRWKAENPETVRKMQHKAYRKTHPIKIFKYQRYTKAERDRQTRLKAAAKKKARQLAQAQILIQELIEQGLPDNYEPQNAPTHRKCCHCKKKKLLVEFARDRNRFMGRGYYCKKCNVLRVRKWQKKNPEKHRAQIRRHYQKHKPKQNISTAGKILRNAVSP